MSVFAQGGRPGRGFWIIASVGLVWNLLGVVSYLMSVTLGPEAIKAMPEAERALVQGTPAWVTAAYAVAVFGGTLASILLLMRKATAVPAFAVSLVAVLLQMGHAFLLTPVLQVRGAAALVLPLLVIVFAVYLLWFARTAKASDWLA